MSARRLAAVIAVGVSAALVVIAVVAHGSLPDPIATHWTHLDHPDGNMRLRGATVLLIGVAIVSLLPTLLSKGDRTSTPWSVATGAGVSAGALVTFLAVVAANWHNDHWYQAHLSIWALAAVLAAAVGAGIVTRRAVR